MASSALATYRICDFTGQLAGAGATRWLAAFGAEVIRIEDPTNQGRWDILRGGAPYVDERRGIELGGAFNNHNVEKLGITLNLRNPKGMAVLHKLIAVSDAVTENFSAGVLPRMGLDYEGLCKIRPDIVYVSNCGFGHEGPYTTFKTWGPSVQAVSGLTFSSGLPDQPPAGWGYSYMDHTGGYFMAIAILAALYHRDRTGEGQYVDYATTESALTLNGPPLLDYLMNSRPLRREGSPNSNRSQYPAMAPHGIYECGRSNSERGVTPTDAVSQSFGRPQDEDRWLAISCRTDEEWRVLATIIAEPWAQDARFAALAGRLDCQDELDTLMSGWTKGQDQHELARRLIAAGIPATAVQTPEERIDKDPNTSAWGLWPEVKHTQMGNVRVDGYPVHFSETDWSMTRGAACLGEHNEYVLGDVLGMSSAAIEELRSEGVL